MAQGKKNSCPICEHPNRGDIDRAIIAGDSLRSIATRFKTSKDAVDRHKKKCMAKEAAVATPITVPVYVTSKEKEATVQTLTSIHDRVEYVLRKLETQMDACSNDQDRRNLVLTANALFKGIEMIGKITGEIKGDSTTVNVAVVTHEFKLVSND